MCDVSLISFTMVIIIINASFNLCDHGQQRSMYYNATEKQTLPYIFVDNVFRQLICKTEAKMNKIKNAKLINSTS